MNEIIYFETDNGVVAIESVNESTAELNFNEGKLRNKFDDAVGIVKDVGSAIVKNVRSIVDAPDEVSMEIGVKFSAEAGAFIAASSEGGIRLNFVWRKKDSEPSQVV